MATIYSDELKRLLFDKPIPVERWKRPAYFREVRKVLGLTQAQFWSAVGVNKVTGAKYERDINDSSNTYRHAPNDVLYRIADTFGLKWEQTPGNALAIKVVNGDMEQVTAEDLALLNFCRTNKIDLDDLEIYCKIRRELSAKS